MFSSFAKLPDALSAEELQPHYDQWLGGLPAASPASAARDLLELSLRQSNSGQPLDSARSQRIIAWIRANWQPADEVLTDRLLGSIVNLNLHACLALLDSALAAADTPAESRELISAARAEM